MRLYLSANVAQDKYTKEYSQDVLRLLEQYQLYSSQHISIKTIDILPFTSSVSEAKKLGVRDNPNLPTIGLVLSDEKGNFITIPHLDYRRRNYLEHDISRAISKLNNYQKPVIGIMSSENKVISSGDTLDYSSDWPFAALLRQDYELQYIASNVAFIPQNIDTLLISNPKNIGNLTAYAIEQYLIRGGSVLIFVDPLSEVTMNKKGILYSTTGIKELLEHHGIYFSENKVVGDALQNRSILQNNQISEYPFWIYAIPNSQHQLTKNLSPILLNSAGFLKVKNHLAIQTLLSTSKQSGEVDASYLKNASVAQSIKKLKIDNNVRTLAVLKEGEFSTYYREPPLNNQQYMDGEYAFLSISKSPGKLLVVSDSDMLNSSHWNANTSQNQETYEYIPYSGNYDFIERAVDYLSDNKAILNVPGKKASIVSASISEILYQKASAKYAKQISDLNNNQQDIIQEQSLLYQKIKNKELLPSISVTRKLEDLERQKIINIQKQSSINGKINSTYKFYMSIFTLINLLIPLILLAVFTFINKYSFRTLTRNIESLSYDA